MNKNVQMEFTAADAIVEELVKAGVKVVFGIVSIHNMPIYDAIKREGSIYCVTARGESGAVNMADGYARSTGKLGVVITSTGTGAGNGAGSLVEAWNAGTPVLHLTGEISSYYLGMENGYIHQCKDQHSMMKGSCKNAYLLNRPNQMYPVIRQAINEAQTPPQGPITLEIPINFQSAIIAKSNYMEDLLTSTLGKSQDVSSSIVKKIRTSKRPVLWTGSGAIASEAAEEVTELAELIGAAVITSQAGKGIIPENHPLCIGHFASYPEVKDHLKKADLLISIGVRFRSNETASWKVEVPKEHISIDIDPKAINRNYESTHGLIGDAKQVIDQLLVHLRQESNGALHEYRREVENVHKQVRTSLRETLGPYEQFVDAMNNILPNNTIIVRDVTVPANVWGSRLVNISKPRTSIHASGGGIGQGLPTAIGAHFGQKDQPVVLMAGDGGFMLNVGEMATAVQENLPLVVLLFDDGGYGVLRSIQDAAYGRQIAVDLTSPDFVLLARSMGFTAMKIQSAEDFTLSLSESIKAKKPTLLTIDMQAVGPMKKPFRGPPGAAEAFQPKKL